MKDDRGEMTTLSLSYSLHIRYLVQFFYILSDIELYIVMFN